MATDLAQGTVGGGLFIGLITGYATKKVIKLAAIIVGLGRTRLRGITLAVWYL